MVITPSTTVRVSCPCSLLVMALPSVIAYAVVTQRWMLGGVLFAFVSVVVVMSLFVVTVEQMLCDVPSKRTDSDNVVNILNTVTTYEWVDCSKLDFERNALVTRTVLQRRKCKVMTATKRTIV